MAFTTKVVHLEGDASGSASGTVGAPAGKLQGVFYKFHGTDSASLAVRNANRDLFTKAGATNSDPLKDIESPDVDNAAGAAITGNIVASATAGLGVGESVDVILIIEV